ncbi:WecB/TagA/CpsF family glycosyltransferase [Chelatococcus daeguensis]|uniref:WecB/TagA/CpsF family glycosyltransferase n=1 Tax=Chelatococcus daeguensis TaxID=444444 RepID=UPI0007AC2001|nr:WecB/TagA/CpsF family glycosyltransferase [Chelatococcus daeguensis]KZE28524.1 hypothetical protein AVW15_06925 [Chelatococcus daeguensis]MBM3083482.1 WecB/TagA/CpsF family glycosyltransferase [Chelatococcus daeguensis]
MPTARSASPAEAAREPLAAPRIKFLGAPFDLLPKDAVLHRLKACSPADRFAYVATPNVDHVVRLSRQPDLLGAYEAAWMCWCDSHQIERLGKLVGLDLPHLNGTDVMERLFAEVLVPGDTLAVVGANAALGEALQQHFPQYRWHFHAPPMGLAHNPLAWRAALDFVAEHPARFVFLAVGSPQSERLALAILEEGRSCGTAFCIGAALEFLAGRKRRAPALMQTLGLEWLHRLLQEPRRLWRRYAGSLLPLMLLFLREVRENGLRRAQKVMPERQARS